jgi:hypothetical protein
MPAWGNAPGYRVHAASHALKERRNPCAPSGRTRIAGLRVPGRCPGLASVGAFIAATSRHARDSRFTTGTIQLQPPNTGQRVWFFGCPTLPVLEGSGFRVLPVPKPEGWSASVESVEDGSGGEIQALGPIEKIAKIRASARSKPGARDKSPPASEAILHSFLTLLMLCNRFLYGSDNFVKARVKVRG